MGAADPLVPRAVAARRAPFADPHIRAAAQSAPAAPGPCGAACRPGARRCACSGSAPSAARTNGRRCGGWPRPAGTRSAPWRRLRQPPCSPTSSRTTASCQSTSAASWTSARDHAICEWPMDHHVIAALEVQPAVLLAKRCPPCPRPRRECPLSPADRAQGARFSRERRAQPARVAAAGTVRPHPQAARWDTAPSWTRTWTTRAASAAGRGGAASAEPRLQPEPDQEIAKEAPAINAPSAPPAITSLG